MECGEDRNKKGRQNNNIAVELYVVVLICLAGGVKHI